MVVVWIARSVELPCQLFPLLFEATFDADAAAAAGAAAEAPFEAVLATSAAVEAVLATSVAVEAAASAFSFSRFFSGGRVGQSSMRWSADLQLWQRLGRGACGHLDARWFAKSPQLKHLRGT